VPEATCGVGRVAANALEELDEPLQSWTSRWQRLATRAQAIEATTAMRNSVWVLR
jgi:hypothetical protein